MRLHPALGWLPGASLVAALASSALALPEFPDSSGIRVCALANGLRVIAVEVPDACTVEVRIFTPVSAAYEPAGQEGIAHLAEHLAFESAGSDSLGSPARALALYSCYANASTGPWGVEFETDCLPEMLPRVLAVEARRILQFACTPAVFEREKSVVRQEIAMRERRGAWSDLATELLRVAYAGGPYGKRRGGADSTVAHLTLDDVFTFHQATTTLASTVVTIQGPMRASEAIDAVKSTWGTLPQDGCQLELVPPGPLQTSKETTILDRYDFEGFSVAMGFRLPRRTQQEQMMVAMLVDLFEQHRLSTTAIPLPGETFLYLGFHFNYARAEGKGEDEDGAYLPDEQTRRAWAVLWDEIQDAVQTGLGAAGFTQTRSRIGQQVRAMAQSRRGIGGLLARELVTGGDLLWMAHVDSLAASLTLPVFSSYVRRALNQNTVKGVVHGRDSGRMQTLRLRSEKPPDEIRESVEGAAESLTSAEIEPVLAVYRATKRRTVCSLRLDNGIPASVVYLTSADETFIGGVRTFAPLKSERAGKSPGLALLYNRAVNYEPGYSEKGLRPLPYGARVRATPVSLRFEAYTRTEDAPAVARAFAGRLGNPELNVQRWSWALGHAQQYVELARQPPGAQAIWHRYAALLGKSSPLLGAWAGDPAISRKVDYGDLRGLHRDVTRTGNLRLVVAGGIDCEAARSLLDSAFAKRPPADANDRPEPLECRLAGIEGQVVASFDRRDCSVGVSMPPIALVGELGWRWEERALVLNVIRDRVYNRLREHRGLSYAAQTAETVVPGYAFLDVLWTTFPATVGTSLRMVHEELRNLATNPLDPKVLALARLKLAGSLTRSLEDPLEAGMLLEEIARSGRVPDDPVLSVLEVSPARAEALLHAWIQPERFAFSVEGPLLEEVIEQLRP